MIFVTFALALIAIVILLWLRYLRYKLSPFMQVEESLEGVQGRVQQAHPREASRAREVLREDPREGEDRRRPQSRASLFFHRRSLPQNPVSMIIVDPPQARVPASGGILEHKARLSSLHSKRELEGV